MKAGNFYSLLLAFVTLTFVSGCAPKVSVPKYTDDVIMITAHRGMAAGVPENSLAAIRQSIRDGVEIIEIDVRRTKDNQLIIMHDQTVDRTTTGSGMVEEMTWEEMKDFRLLHDGVPTKEPILTFEEALRAGNGKVIFDLDLKTERIDLVMEVVEEQEAQWSVVFFDSDWEVLEQVQARHPDWYLMPRAYDVEMAKEAYEKFKPWAIHVDPSFASAELSEYFQERKVYVWINALGDVDRALEAGDINPLRELLKTKPSIIQTDHPGKLKALTRNLGAANQYQQVLN